MKKQGTVIGALVLAAALVLTSPAGLSEAHAAGLSPAAPQSVKAASAKAAKAKPAKKKVKISKAKITVTKKVVYTGKGAKVKVKATYKGKALKKGRDFKVSYLNAVKNPMKHSDVVGTGYYYVKIKGKGDFKGTALKRFKIVARPKDKDKNGSADAGTGKGKGNSGSSGSAADGSTDGSKSEKAASITSVVTWHPSLKQVTTEAWDEVIPNATEKRWVRYLTAYDSADGQDIVPTTTWFPYAEPLRVYIGDVKGSYDNPEYVDLPELFQNYCNYFASDEVINQLIENRAGMTEAQIAELKANRADIKSWWPTVMGNLFDWYEIEKSDGVSLYGDTLAQRMAQACPLYTEEEYDKAIDELYAKLDSALSISAYGPMSLVFGYEIDFFTEAPTVIHHDAETKWVDEGHWEKDWIDQDGNVLDRNDPRIEGDKTDPLAFFAGSDILNTATGEYLPHEGAWHKTDAWTGSWTGTWERVS